jgi:NAD(P)-dependent dehydrogenase (short-subunit alcohol dehydrogenase family)
VDPANVVLVTNVGQGFGRAIALGYGRAAFDVVCADTDVDLASKTAAEIEEHGGQAIPIQADMTTQMDVLNAFQKVFDIFGQLGGVVHVAAQASYTPFEQLTESEFGDLIDEDLRSSYLVLRAAARLLRGAFVVFVLPPEDAVEPHMRALRGSVIDLVAGADESFGHLRVNAVLPSRPASDPRHDARVVEAVRHLGSLRAEGVGGHTLRVRLPPPPQLVESLLPEVQAALDEDVRQDDLEALYREAEAEDDDGDDDEGDGRNGNGGTLP